MSGRAEVKTIPPVRFACVKCGKEIWQKMPEEIKANLTIAEAEATAVCWDCSHKERRKVKGLINLLAAILNPVE